MVRKLLLLSIIFVSFFCSAEPLLWYPVDSLFNNAKTNETIKITFGSIISTRTVIMDNYWIFFPFVISIKKNDQIYILKRNIDENGYKYIDGFASNQQESRFFLVYGKFNFLYVCKTGNNYYGAVKNTSLNLDSEIWSNIIQQQTSKHGEYFILDQGLKGIKASSSLIEKISGGNVKYDVGNILNRIAILNLEDPNDFEYLNFKRCWAEGVPGSGVGEWLEMDFKWPSNEITILNGYIDFFRMNLYKDNGRLKRIKIESTSPVFSIEYEFEDVVKFHDIKLPATTTNVRITILEVYAGRKYSDTCVSMISIPAQRWRSYEVEKAEVEIGRAHV